MTEFQEGMIVGAIIYFILQAFFGYLVWRLWPRSKPKAARRMVEP